MPPCNYTRKDAQAVLDLVAQGLSLRNAVREHGIPAREQTFYHWLAGNVIDAEECAWLNEQYLRAREAQSDAIFDECLAISDDADVETVQVKKLQIDTRMRMAGKLKPKKYGEQRPGATPDEPLHLAGNVAVNVTGI